MAKGPSKFEWQIAMSLVNIPDHPGPDCKIMDSIDGLRRLQFRWGDAHATLAYFPCEGCGVGHIVFWEELCSYAGREHPTGLYTELVDRLVPLAEELGTYIVACEPATDFAADKLRRLGNWAKTPDGVWVWTLADVEQLNLEALAKDTKALVQRVRQDR